MHYYAHLSRTMKMCWGVVLENETCKYNALANESLQYGSDA